MSLRIGIIHYCIGLTDGVSLEIHNRKTILEKLGHTVKLISGPCQTGSDYVLEEFSTETGLAEKVHFNKNGSSKYKCESDLQKDFRILVDSIKLKLTRILENESFDLLLVHNIFSLGRYPAECVALLQTLDLFRIPVIATHHDFYWGRTELKNRNEKFILDIYEDYHLPKRSYINHVVINSINKRELLEKRGITAEIMHDSFDFEQPRWKTDKYSNGLKKYLGIDQDTFVVLQATRIVPRKGIEMAIDYVSILQKHLDKNVLFVLPNYVDSMEADARNYAKKLKRKAKKLNVDIKLIGNRVNHQRRMENGNRIYSLWDAYALADLVTYPSLIEGWGNQFLEAIFAKKPILVFEYPVFRTDIKPQGYKIISLGNKIDGHDEEGLIKLKPIRFNKAVKETLKLLGNDQLVNKVTSENFKIAKRNHSFKILEKHLVNNMKSFKLL